MSILLFDLPNIRRQLLPFTYTRCIGDIRVGIMTIREKWAFYFKSEISTANDPFSNAQYTRSTYLKGDLLVNSSICPTSQLFQEINELKNGQKLLAGPVLIAVRLANKFDQLTNEIESLFPDYQVLVTKVNFRQISSPPSIFQHNGEQIRADFELMTKSRNSQKVTDPHTIVYGEENLFLEEGVTVKASIINASDGPVYLGKNSVIHEGSIIKGPFSLGESAHINMGAKMKGDNTIGPYCKVGGEVSNCVFFGYSNKGHDGFLGNSVIGEWCNLGADTNNSNLKNNYSKVKIWDYPSEQYLPTSLQFCGLLMGDHSKSGINTMFNTGTVVGVSANVFGAGFPPKFIPSFSWGGADGFTTFDKEKAFEAAKAMMGRRKVPLTDSDRSVLSEIFEQSSKYRNKGVEK